MLFAFAIANTTKVHTQTMQVALDYSILKLNPTVSRLCIKSQMHASAGMGAAHRAAAAQI